MAHGRLSWLVLIWVFPVWGELPLPAPEVRQSRVISRGVEESVPQLPWRWMTWNLQWFPGQHPQATMLLQQRHIQSVGQLVKGIWPQVALLQEVLDGEALRMASPVYPWRVVTSFQRAGDENEALPAQNLALVSQWPWKEVWEVDFYRLPLTPDRPVRGFIGAKFQDDQGRAVTLYGVHLKSNRGGRESSARRRERAMEYLRWDWRRLGLDPDRDFMMIAGDFNCSTRNPEFSERTIRQLVQEGWGLADQELGWPKGATVKPDPQGKFPAADFDHFLLSPALVRVRGAGRQDLRIFSRSEIPSDHYPVELILEIKR